MKVGSAAVKTESELRNVGVFPGRYHAIVKDVDETEAVSKWQSIVVNFEILAGTVPGQERKAIKTFFNLKDSCLPRLDLFAIVLGLKAPGEVKDVSFQQAVGKQLVIEVEEQEYKGKKQNAVAWTGFWRLEHPDVKDVPRDKTMLARASAPQSAATQPAPAGAAAAGWAALS